MTSDRIRRLPAYPFAEIEKKISERKNKGKDVISFAIGDPDLEVPEFIVNEASRAMKERAGQSYPSSEGELFFREAVSEWYRKRFKVSLDPEREVIALIGSKEGIANISRAFIDRGDRVLVPDPGYPVYSQGATILCDGIVQPFLLREENGFLPDTESIEGKAKMMFFSYPNNPTGAVAKIEDFREIADFCDDRGILACHDNAYSEITFDGFEAPSFLQCSMNGVEFHSLSKTFNMTGFRIGFCAGNEEIIKALKMVKSQIDSGPSIFVQRAAAKALDAYSSSERPECVMNNVRTYEKRRDLLYKGLSGIGIDCKLPKGTFYLWVKAKDGSKFAEELLEKDVAVTPGAGFGNEGEQYVRFALTQPENRISDALRRLGA